MACTTTTTYSSSSSHLSSERRFELSVKFSNGIVTTASQLGDHQRAQTINQLGNQVFMALGSFFQGANVGDLLVYPKYEIGSCGLTYKTLEVKDQRTRKRDVINLTQCQFVSQSAEPLIALLTQINGGYVESLKFSDCSVPIQPKLQTSTIKEFDIRNKSDLDRLLKALPEKERNRFYEVLGYMNSTGFLAIASTWEVWREQGFQIYQNMKDNEVSASLQKIQERYLNEFPTLQYLLALIPGGLLKTHEVHMFNVFSTLLFFSKAEIDRFKFARLYKALPLELQKEIIEAYKSCLGQGLTWDLEPNNFCEALTLNEISYVFHTIFKHNSFVQGVVTFINSYNQRGNISFDACSFLRIGNFQPPRLNLQLINGFMKNISNEVPSLLQHCQLGSEQLTAFLQDAGLSYTRYMQHKANFLPQSQEESVRILTALSRHAPYLTFAGLLSSHPNPVGLILQINNRNISRENLEIVWHALPKEEQMGVYAMFRNYLFIQQIKIYPFETDLDSLPKLISEEMLPQLVFCISQSRSLSFFRNLGSTPNQYPQPFSPAVALNQAPVSYNQPGFTSQPAFSSPPQAGSSAPSQSQGFPQFSPIPQASHSQSLGSFRAQPQSSERLLTDSVCDEFPNPENSGSGEQTERRGSDDED